MAPLIDHGLNQELAKAFSVVFLNESKLTPSILVQQSIKADKAQEMYYYARPQEVSARAFERMIQEHPIKNNFLVSGTIKSKEALNGLYPSGEALEAIKYHLYGYFKGLSRSLQTQVK